MLTVRKQRAKLINDLPLEFRKLIEDVTVDRNGNVIPKLYSKDRANRGLREMLNIGRTDDRPETGVSQLSDAELIQQLADTAKELGIDINLNYSFAQLPPAAEADAAQTDGSPPVETVSADVAAAAELRIAAQPEFAGARPKDRSRR